MSAETKNVSARDVLLRAAERVERGWCQKAWSSPGRWPWSRERVCALGAIYEDLDYWQEAEEAAALLRRHLGCPVDSWNDARGRTQAEVAATLREAAANA